jgi:hypothetical protein
MLHTSTRLPEKSWLHALQVELQYGYSLSPVEAEVLARRVQQMIDERSGMDRATGQITYQAIALSEPAGKPLATCRKVAVQLTVLADDDAEVLAKHGSEALRRLRVHRLVTEAQLQGGALSQEDLSLLLGLSLKSIKRIFASYRAQGQRLLSRGELCDIGPGVSHKVPVIRKYVQDLSLPDIAQQLGHHGLQSMTRYLRHFALVMVLQDRGLTPEQMHSVVGISLSLIEQYRQLYQELQRPEYERTLERLKGVAFCPPLPPLDEDEPLREGKKGALR